VPCGLAARLTTHPAEESHPAISPDGATLAFSAAYEGPVEVYTMPVAGGAPTARSGHAINLEEPALFNQFLESFFHQVEAGRWSARDKRSLVPSIYGPGGKP